MTGHFVQVFQGAIIAIGVGLALRGLSSANPHDPVVRSVNGNVQFMGGDDGVLTILQKSQRAIIDWKDFLISANEITRSPSLGALGSGSKGGRISINAGIHAQDTTAAIHADGVERGTISPPLGRRREIQGAVNAAGGGSLSFVGHGVDAFPTMVAQSPSAPPMGDENLQFHRSFRRAVLPALCAKDIGRSFSLGSCRFKRRKTMRVDDETFHTRDTSDNDAGTLMIRDWPFACSSGLWAFHRSF